MKEVRHKRPHNTWFYLYELPVTGKSIETEIRLEIRLYPSEIVWTETKKISLSVYVNYSDLNILELASGTDLSPNNLRAEACMILLVFLSWIQDDCCSFYC